MDLLDGHRANLLDRHTYGFLLTIAASGRLRVLLGSPPCRTISALRRKDDGGPGILRSEEWPYGLPDLSMADAEKVHQHSILFFRYLSLLRKSDHLRIQRRNLSWSSREIQRSTDPMKMSSNGSTCLCFALKSGNSFRTCTTSTRWILIKDLLDTNVASPLHVDGIFVAVAGHPWAS